MYRVYTVSHYTCHYISRYVYVLYLSRASISVNVGRQILEE